MTFEEERKGYFVNQTELLTKHALRVCVCGNNLSVIFLSSFFLHTLAQGPLWESDCSPSSAASSNRSS